MRKIADMATGSLIQGPLCLRPSTALTASIQIPNRKSGIRIRLSPQKSINYKFLIANIRHFCVRRGKSRFLISASVARPAF